MGDVRQVQFGGGTSRNQAAEKGSESPAEAGNVVDLGSFRTRKSLASDRKVGIGEAFSGTPSAAAQARLAGRGDARGDARSDVELSERIERIKNSINRINQLMSDLRTAAKDDEERGPKGK